MRVAVLMLVLVGCGGEGVSVHEWADARRAWQCRYYAQCGIVRDVATCDETNIGWYWTNPFLIEAVDDGRVKWDASGAERCLDQRVSCDMTRSDHWLICDSFTTGTLHDGETCAVGAECISRECAIPDDCSHLCCKGTCVGDTAPVPALLGDSCRASDCLEGYCNGDTCVPHLAEGARCPSSYACDDGLACVSGPGDGGTCLPLSATGEQCKTGCANVGDHCIDGVCKRVKLLGEECTQHLDCSSLYICGDDGRCFDPGVATGESCAATGRCAASDAYCDSSTSKCELRSDTDTVPICPDPL